jgi:hypothetical protein
MPVFSRLAEELRKADTKQEATYWLEKTDALIKYEDKKGAASLDGSR